MATWHVRIAAAALRGAAVSVPCPLCGGGSLERSEETEAIPVPYGPECSYVSSVERCLDCGEASDFSGLNDARIEAALSSAVHESVGMMLDDLARQGLSMPHLERALRLPQRTLATWREGECPPAGVALLRTIRTYPWIVRVADDDFEHDVADDELARAFGQLP
jgi:hypothetical protein